MWLLLQLFTRAPALCCLRCPPLPQVPKPDVVLTSYEAFTADAAELKAITWEAAVLDERHPWQRAALAKAHTALCDLSAR